MTLLDWAVNMKASTLSNRDLGLDTIGGTSARPRNTGFAEPAFLGGFQECSRFSRMLAVFKNASIRANRRVSPNFTAAIHNISTWPRSLPIPCYPPSCDGGEHPMPQAPSCRKRAATCAARLEYRHARLSLHLLLEVLRDRHSALCTLGQMGLARRQQ